MSTSRDRRLHRSDWPLMLISALAFLFCLFYTLTDAFVSPPYSGLTFNSEWVVTYVDPCDAHPGWCEANQDGLRALQIGDQLVAIGELTFEEYRNAMHLVPFDGYGTGDSVPVTFGRDGERQTIHWHMPVVTSANRAKRLSSLLFYLPFWLVGTAVLLFLQPRDTRWRLLVACNYLTAIWLAAGIVSSWRVAGSALVMRAATWLMVPVYLHFHLVVPAPLFKSRPRYSLPLCYAVAIILAALELPQLLPGSAYSLGLLLAITGSVGLLVSRLFPRASPSVRLAAHIMLAGIGLAFGPGLVLWVVPELLNVPGPGDTGIALATLAIPVLPVFYGYAVYKRRLGDLEFRANRVLSLYSFILLYLTAFVLVFQIGSRWIAPPDSPLAFSLALSLLFAVAGPPLRVRFQRLVDRVVYGTDQNPDDLLRIFASRIAAALDHRTLAHVLAEEVSPSLLIRQSALCLVANEDASPVYARGVGMGETPKTLRHVQQLLEEAGRYRPPEPQPRNGFDWVRLAIPLVTREKTVGIWLFGRRDPDDYYPEHDITLLTALASQVAVAAENARLYNQAQQEIAERSRAEKALRESERKYRRVVDNANEGIIVIQDGKLVFVNPKVAEMTRYPMSELANRPFMGLVHSDDRKMVLDHYLEMIRGERLPSTDSFRLIDKEGEVVWVESSAVRITWEGMPGTLSFLSDTTDRIELEQQLRQAIKMESIGRLAGGVAHDFANILTSINGFATLVQEELASSHPVQAYVSWILESGARGSDLTSQLLAFSRKQITRPRIVDLNQVVAGMEQMLRRTIGEDIEMQAILVPDLSSVRVDLSQMEQVIVNLAVNARDAMPHGGTLTIETGNVVLDEEYAARHLGARPGEHVMLAIRDTGVGMSEHVQSHIFEPFFTTKEEGEGTGLGLAMVYNIVKQSKGHIWFHSEEGVGTTFKIYLPRVLEEAEATLWRDDADEIPVGNETILLVEDEHAVRELVGHILQMAGYTILRALSPEVAMEQARGHPGPIHLLFTDVVMPGMSGYELADRIAQIRPEAKVLYMSGYPGGAFAGPVVLDPGTAFIQKPFSSSSVARKVREVLDSM